MVVATVSVELAPDVTEVGLNEVVTPAGAPVTLRATVWAPTAVAVVIVALPMAPAGSSAGGAGAIEKS